MNRPGEHASRSVLLHIVDGESVAGTLRASNIPGDVRIYGDLLYEGPTPSEASADDWLDVRARFLAQNGKTTIAEARRYLETFENTLKAARTYDEVIVWLDHRLSNQLILIRLLDWLSRQETGAIQLSLICIGQYPGMTRFVGLGYLNAEQLLSLADIRLQVTREQVQLGRQAWGAFTSPNPTEIESIIKIDTSSLPFLAAALHRHLQQFPSVDNGLSRTEHQILASLCDGSLTAIQLFGAVQRMEPAVFMGDWSFFRILTELASVRYPLLESVGDGPFDLYEDPTTPVIITQVGFRVLKGLDDHIGLNGIDRWIGGVHLTGADGWRWSDATGRLVTGR